MAYRIIISEEQDTTETLELVRALLAHLHLVLHADWDYSASCLSDEWQRFFIHPQGTFLAPGQEDESNNWGNRGALLGAYRALCAHVGWSAPED
jgi:hypothetical protein